MPKPIVTIFTDGSCSPNPGHGGWAALLRCSGKEKMISGKEPDTTNNRMEMLAIIRGLQALKKPCVVHVVCDNKMVINCARGIWKRKSNRDLWQEYSEAAFGHIITFEWVKGHNGHTENERVDAEANRQATSR